MDYKRLTVGLGLLVGACNTPLALRPTFDGPTWTDILEAEEGGPFWTPIAFVVNSRDGSIVPVDLRHNTAVSDQLGGPFLPPRKVATGDERQLGQVEAWSPGDESVDVFVVDYTHEVMVQASYLTGVDPDTGEPIPPEHTVTDPVFVDADGSGNSATLSNIELRHGFTTTEDWTVSFDGTDWWVSGSRSGPQTRHPIVGKSWTSDNREITFTLRGLATDGDYFTFSTDTGLLEHDLGAVPLAIEAVPNSDLLLVGVWDRVLDEGSVLVWDALAGSEVGRVPLFVGAQPWRFTWTDDGTLVVGDARRSAVYFVSLDTEAPEQSVVEELVTLGPVEAVAFVSQEEDELAHRSGFRHLFVAPIDDNRVDLYDIDADVWVDVNPRDGVFGGLDLRSPVVGLSTVPKAVQLVEVTNQGSRVNKLVVAVTTMDGALRLIEGDTGCLAIDGQGARLTTDDPSSDLVVFSDLGETSNPYFVSDEVTGRQVVSSACGGIARDESWSLVYDGLLGAWRAFGAVSGEQEGLVYEDQRYTTDNGALSWMILSGTRPSTDGDLFAFNIDDGVLEMSEVPAASNTFTTFNLPAAPLGFTMDMGPSGGGWDKDRTKAHILLPVTNSDIVVRVRPQGWYSEVVWQ